MGEVNPERLRVGDKVVFGNDWLREKCPGIYPAADVVGDVTGRRRDGYILVKWPAGSCDRAQSAWGTQESNLKRAEVGRKRPAAAGRRRDITVIHPVYGRTTVVAARDKLDAVTEAARRWKAQWSVIARESTFEEGSEGNEEGQ